VNDGVTKKVLDRRQTLLCLPPARTVRLTSRRGTVRRLAGQVPALRS